VSNCFNPPPTALNRLFVAKPIVSGTAVRNTTADEWKQIPNIARCVWIVPANGERAIPITGGDTALLIHMPWNETGASNAIETKRGAWPIS
jgi:hypothetical protein